MPFAIRPQPCWLVLQEGDWLGCGRCWGRAVWLAAQLWGEELAAGAVTEGPPVIVRAETPCVEMCCVRCGAWWVDPVSGLRLHGVSEGEARSAAVVDGWVGEVCPECVAAAGMS
ncbi:hypothetical protein ABZY58_11300 [Micromonospora tulbaghiae]|uniref:hypothetical protein n=1 Tax=Micromonospora tulbaghiae TaxID=479978 RepID=UPI0033AE52E0